MNIDKVVQILKDAKQTRSEFVDLMDTFNPYLVLISCILSLRTNDRTTYPATLRMLELAKTPREMKGIGGKELAEAIYPVGFYENKAKQIIELSRQIDEELGGVVPDEIEDLIKFKGVGRRLQILFYQEVSINLQFALMFMFTGFLTALDMLIRKLLKKQSLP